MDEAYIIKLLQAAIKSFTQLPVKYLNTNFQIPSDGKWWEIIYLPNNYEDEFWGGGKTYRGIFRPILHWPQDNGGVYKPLAEVKRVADGYPKSLKLIDAEHDVTVSITDVPDVNNIIEEPPGLLIPLTIKYLCYKV